MKNLPLDKKVLVVSKNSTPFHIVQLMITSVKDVVEGDIVISNEKGREDFLNKALDELFERDDFIDRDKMVSHVHSYLIKYDKDRQSISVFAYRANISKLNRKWIIPPTCYDYEIYGKGLDYGNSDVCPYTESTPYCSPGEFVSRNLLFYFFNKEILEHL